MPSALCGGSTGAFDRKGDGPFLAKRGMARERILITVKTYPTLSRKYGETVCTAGVRPDGSWVRIYPVPFRRLEQEEQYKKYDWIEIERIKSRSDPRPETHHPADMHQLVPFGHLDTSDEWRARR